MSPLSIKLGFWSAALCAATFVIFTFCFAAILFINPLFLWTNFEDWVNYSRQYDQFFKHLAQLMMLLFGPLYVILTGAIYDYTQSENKVLSRISFGFALIFAALIGIHYFIQISIIRLNLAKDNLVGLEQFIQANPTSAVSGINMLGWTLFFGLSCLFAAPIFSGNRLQKLIRYSFLANGIFMLLGAVGFILNITILVFMVMNLGMGVAVLTFSIALAFLFHRLERSSISEPTDAEGVPS